MSRKRRIGQTNAILEALRQSSSPLSIGEIAGRMGLRKTVVGSRLREVFRDQGVMNTRHHTRKRTNHERHE